MFIKTGKSPIALFTMLLLLSSLGSAQADVRVSSACFIQSSPFYHRLLQSGIFDIPVVQPSGDPQPVQMLFRVARSFRYESDRKKTDQWQTAEQTSKSYGGDCEDKAIWLYTQLRQNGYHDVSLAIGKYGPLSSRFHMWVTYVDENGQTFLLDPTIQRKPWKINSFPKNFYRPSHIISGKDCISL